MIRPDSRKRLCMVVHGPYPIGEPRVAREAAIAVDRGYAVDVIAMRRPGEPAKEIIEGVLVIRLPVGHVRGRGMARVLLEYLLFVLLAAGVVAKRGGGRRYDVVHIHNPPDFLILAAAIPRLLGSRVIFDVHDLSPEMFAMRFPGPLGTAASRALRWIERVATLLPDAIITVHEPYRRQLIGRGAPADKITVVMNSVDERLLPAPKPSTARRPFRVVYHGTVTPPYGVHLLIEAAKTIAHEALDLRVEIFGEGDSTPELKRRVAASGLDDRVCIEDRYAPHRTVLERVNGASAGVIPNLPTALSHFALSSKLFEYVVLGVPVISAALPTIREHFSDEELFYFDPGDAGSLAAALIAVAGDPEGASVRAANARRRYEDYRWEINAHRYASILDALSSRAPRAPASVPSDGRGEGST